MYNIIEIIWLILLILKIAGVIALSWWIVLLWPLVALIIFFIISFILFKAALASMPNTL